MNNDLTLTLKLADTTRAIVYLFVYSTWSTSARVAPFPINGTAGTVTVERPPLGTVLPHYASIVLQTAEMIDARVVLTACAVIPIAELTPDVARTIAFVDVAQADAVTIEGTVSTIDAVPLFSTAEPDLPTLFSRFDAATADYVRTHDDFVASMSPSRPDLPSLYMTSFAQRIGRKFPDLLFFNMERTPVTDPAVLEKLLRAACFYIGISEPLFIQACSDLTILGQGSGVGLDGGPNPALMAAAMEAIVFAACLPAIATPYAFDKYVGAFGETKVGERFSSMRVPTLRRRDAVADCEEMAKSNAVLLFDMQTAAAPPSLTLLAAAQQALASAAVYSSLMLVKSPNVDLAKAGGDSSDVPLEGSTGHMCGLLQRGGNFSLAAIPLAGEKEDGLTGVLLAEGTGNILSDIRPYAAAERNANEAFQARIKRSPFAANKWEQRLNMTHGALFVDDVMHTPNGFYAVLKYAFLIYRGMENARSFLAVNARAHTYGVPVSNLVAPGTDATLLALPEMRPDTRMLCAAMMGFIPPEMPLAIGPDPPASVTREVDAWNARLRKGSPERATNVASFMKDYGEITDASMSEIAAWINATDDIVHSEIMIFGALMHSYFVIVRLFFQ